MSESIQKPPGRVAVPLTFALVGAAYASWAARVPAVADDLGLGPGDLAVALTGLEAGALLGLQAGAMLVPRLGSRTALAATLPLFAAGLAGPGLVRGLAGLTVALFAWAGLNSVADVAMNTAGVALERAADRPLLTGLHAMHSLGGIAGAGLGAGAAALGIGRTEHLTGLAVLFALVAIVTVRRLPRLDEPAVARPGAWRRGWSRRLLLLGGLAFCLTLTESSAVNWGAIWLRDSAGTGAATAGTGVAGFLAAMAAGRLAGDRLRARLGPVTLFRAGALLGGAGLGAALLLPGPVTGVAGLVLLGLGVSVLLPLAIAAAPAAGDGPAATAVARVSTVGYLGSFAGPGLIGAAAGVSGLTAALAIPAVAVAGTALAARATRQGHPRGLNPASAGKPSGAERPDL
jgi:hypothetical protein